MSDTTFTPSEPIVIEPGQAPAEPIGITPLPANSNAAPEPTPAKHSPAQHPGLSVDERAYQQYQSLAQVVLDSADIATKSAQAAATASSDMRRATTELRDLTDNGHKKARLLLIVTGSVMVISLLFFLTMGVRMNSRINQLDAMLMAVGKRVVDLNVGMESLDTINRSIEGLSSQQAALTKAQADIEGRINASLKQSETLVQSVPGETAKQVAANSDNLLKQVQGINNRLQGQASAVQSLSNEVKALKGNVGNVDKLNRDVEALVTLQKERYLEALQKNNATATRERAVQFPRVNPPKAPGETTGTPASTTGTPGPPQAR
jgi:prefoldin subunit 5